MPNGYFVFDYGDIHWGHGVEEIVYELRCVYMDTKCVVGYGEAGECAFNTSSIAVSLGLEECVAMSVYLFEVIVCLCCRLVQFSSAGICWWAGVGVVLKASVV